MKLVIDIDEKRFNTCKTKAGFEVTTDFVDDIMDLVINAIPLEEVLEDIENGIQTTNSKDAYSTGMRNGMKWVKSLLDGKEPKFDDCEEPSIKEVLEDIKSEIEEKFGCLTICEWEENYDFEENDISEYVYVSEVKEILELIDKHISGKEKE